MNHEVQNALSRISLARLCRTMYAMEVGAGIAEAQSVYNLIALYAGHARLLQAELPPLTRSLVRCEKT